MLSLLILVVGMNLTIMGCYLERHIDVSEGLADNLDQSLDQYYLCTIPSLIFLFFLLDYGIYFN